MRVLLLILGMLLLVAGPMSARADDFRIVSYFSAKEEYNSNIMFSANNPKGDFITTLSPGVEVAEKSERLDSDLSLRLDRLEYLDNRKLSATNQVYNGKLRYMVTPLLGVSAEGGYSRNANPTLNIGPTGIAAVFTPWTRMTSSASADYQLSELMGAGVSYSYGRDHYKNRSDLDDISHDIGAGLVYDLGKYFPATQGRINSGYSHYSFSGGHINSITGTVGFTRNLNEMWSISIDSGIRRTTSEITAKIGEEDVYDPIFGIFIIGTRDIFGTVITHGWGWVAKAALNYKGEKSSGELSYMRDISPAYGFSGAAERNALTLTSQYRMTYELSLLCSAGYYTLKSNSSQFSVHAIDRKTLSINPGLRYEFSRDVFAELYYGYTRVLDMSSDAHRHIFGARLYMQHRFFE